MYADFVDIWLAHAQRLPAGATRAPDRPTLAQDQKGFFEHDVGCGVEDGLAPGRATIVTLAEKAFSDEQQQAVAREDEARSFADHLLAKRVLSTAKGVICVDADVFHDTVGTAV